MQILLQDIRDAQRRYEKDDLTKGPMTFKSNVFFQSQKIQQFISQQKNIDLLKVVIGPDIWVHWDQAVAKGPGSRRAPSACTRMGVPYGSLKIAIKYSLSLGCPIHLLKAVKSNRQHSLPLKIYFEI